MENQTSPPVNWYESFFDELYYKTYRMFEGEERNEREARLIMELLGLKEGARVLDLGCGYARHAVYLAKWGMRVTCFDFSSYLLEKARERIKEYGVEEYVELVRGDMRRLDYNEEFDAVYMFFTTFGYFDDKDNVRVIENVYNALVDDGKLLIDSINLHRVSYQSYTNNGEWRTWYHAGPYLILEESSLDILTGQLKTTRHFYIENEGKKTTRSFMLRIYSYWELKKILEDSGFTLVNVYGSYRLEPYIITSPRMIVIAKKQAK